MNQYRKFDQLMSFIQECRDIEHYCKKQTLYLSKLHFSSIINENIINIAVKEAYKVN